MKKINSQLLLACSLFILLVVLCFSWISTEMFQTEQASSTSVVLNNNYNNNNINTRMNTSEGIEQHNVTPISSSTYTKVDPSGFNGLSYFQDFSKHVNSTNLPRQ